MVTRQEIEEAKQTLKEAEVIARERSGKKIPQRRFGAGVSPQQQQQVVRERQEARERLKEIETKKEEVKKVEKEVKRRESFESDRRKAFRIATSSDSRAVFGLENERQREFYRYYKDRRKGVKARQKLKELYEKEGVEPIYDKSGKLVGVRDVLKGQSVGVEQFNRRELEDLKRYERAGIIEVKEPKDTTSAQKLYASVFLKSYNRPLTTAEKIEKGYRDINSYLRRKVTSKVSDKRIKQFSKIASAGSVGTSLIGVGSVGIGGTRGREYSQTVTESIALDVKRNPLTYAVTFGAGVGVGATLKGAGLGLKAVPKAVPYVEKGVVAGGGLLAIQYAKGTIKDITGYKVSSIVQKPVKVEDVSPKEAIRRASIETARVGTFGAGVGTGLKSFDKVSDIIRTFGKQKLPQEQVIAPEYYQGQKYPKIKPGQTPKQLRKEFLESILPGEKKGVPRMFTASPTSFPKETTALPGSSELEGLYGAGKVSPTFLKISSEYKKIGFKDFLKPSQPTVLRTTLQDLKFVPGVKPGQTSLRPLNKELKKFIKEEAEKGTGYIPFIKPEKEAVVPVGSPLKVIEKQYYFKFKGRKVPIFQTVTEAELKTLPKGVKPQDLDKFLSSYYGRTTKYPIYNPLSSSFYTGGKVFSSGGSSVSNPLSSYRSYGKGSSSIYSVLRRVSSSSSRRSGGSGVSIRYNKYSYGGGSRRGGGPPRSPPYPPTRSPPPPPPEQPPIKLPQIKGGLEEDIATGYRTFVIKGGKKVFLPGIRAKSSALRLGSKEARQTLRATFGVTPTSIKVKAPKVPGFRPSPIQFRGYRIKQGKKVNLKDIYIQRKGRRLSSRSEVSSIQRARRINGL